METRETFFQQGAVGDGCVADNDQNVAAGGVDLGDYILGQEAAFGVIKVEIGGQQNSHRSPF